MRWLGVVAVVSLLILAWIAYDQDRGPFGLSGEITLQVIWMIMALLLVSGAAGGFRRVRMHPRIAIAGIFIWAAIIIIAVLAYRIFNP